jgi:hypothetical protein
MKTAIRGSSVPGLPMARRYRVFRYHGAATHTPLRVNDCQFVLGSESANMRKSLLSYWQG